ncbi:MAG: hypothetical protein SWC40_06755 [Thermodesulfobacteriota bacterium]|nr:hypothetical protein [Thermodesulfobacteriota bacterium]
MITLMRMAATKMSRAKTQRDFLVFYTGFESLDMDRIENYFRVLLKLEVPARADLESWRRLLLNCDLLVAADDAVRASVAGLLLFGKKRSIGAYASS